MIAYLKGVIVDISEDQIILEVQDIGYNIKISQNMLERLPGIGSTVQIFTYTMVKEDAFQLYGFLTRDDLSIFKKLITVNGIGPKGAQGILSFLSADDLRFAILSGDSKTIAKAPGIGVKTAERLILDLKDKVSLADTFEHAFSENQSGNKEIHAESNDAVEALVALGYSPSDALRAVKKITITEDMDSEQILKMALKAMY